MRPATGVGIAAALGAGRRDGSTPVRAMVVLVAAVALLLGACAGTQATFNSGVDDVGAGASQNCEQDSDCSEPGAVCQLNVCVRK